MIILVSDSIAQTLIALERSRKSFIAAELSFESLQKVSRRVFTKTLHGDIEIFDKATKSSKRIPPMEIKH